MARFTRSSVFFMFLLLAALFVSACVPEKTVQWSTDGEQAAVLSNGRLYLCDSRGKLSNPLAEGVALTAWLPDSNHMVMVRKQEIDSWEELVKAAPLDFDEKKTIAAAMTARDELLNYSGDLDDFKPSNAGSLNMEQWALALFYLKERGDAPFLERTREVLTKLDDMKVEVRTVQVAAAFPDRTSVTVTLFTTLDEITDLRLSPDGGALAFVSRHAEGLGGSEETSLMAVPTEAGAPPIHVAAGVSAHPDWSPDGRSLYFVRCQGSRPDSASLGRMTRRMVRDARGTILVELPAAQDIATVVFRDTIKVRCLLDGRVLFAANEITLPAGEPQIPDRLTLFILDPATPASVHRIWPPSMDPKIPDRADLFELSPDQNRVAVPGSKGRVSVVTLATGESTAIIDKDGSDDLRTIPVWRNPDQLCLVVPAGSRYGSPRRSEVVLWSPGKVAPISRNWPDEVIAGIK